jgi:hypothetical protein
MFGLKRFRIRTRYNEIVKSGFQSLFRDIDHAIIHHQYTHSPKDFMMLSEIHWKKREKEPQKKIEQLSKELGWFDEFNIINSDGKTTLAMFQGTYDPRYIELFTLTMKEYLCILEFPLFIGEEYGEGRLVGPPGEVKRLVEFVQAWGTDLEIVAVKDFHTIDKGILTILTDRQLEVLRTANQLGYFERPKKMDSRDIAHKMGISHATFLAHIRKSEKRIFSALLDSN